MEKRNVVEPNRTPPEHEEDKTASDLEDHVTKRAGDAVKDELEKQEREEKK